jgi:hypothetical protein
MLFLWLLVPAVATALFQVYNGVIDGNICTAATPALTQIVTVQGPAVPIKINQLAFQTAGSYSESAITINGFSGEYDPQCCSCDAISQSVNGGFSECGLTWCGQENQWRSVDFSGWNLVVPPNDNITLFFANPAPIASNANGDPIFSVSYAIASPSQTVTPSQTSSETPSESVSASPTKSLSASASMSSSSSPSESVTPSETRSSSVI